MQHFKPMMRTSLSGNSFPIVASHGSAGAMAGWSSLSLTIELRHIIRDIVGSARWQRQLQHCSPTFVFSIWGYQVAISKNMDASCRRKTNNGKRTRKQTRLIRFKRGNVIEIRNGIMFELPHFIQISTTLLTRFLRYRKRSILRELVEVVYNSHSRLFSLSFFTPRLATG